MMDDDTKTEARRPFLRVIQGGAGQPQPRAAVRAPARRLARPVEPLPGSIPAQGEDVRLNQAILRLRVDGIGQTVEETLQEMSDKLHSEEDADIARWGVLEDRLKEMGLKFHGANPALELAREGFLVLAWPERLLRRHPELSGLHPLAHPMMPVG